METPVTITLSAKDASNLALFLDLAIDHLDCLPTEQIEAAKAAYVALHDAGDVLMETHE